MPGAVTRYAKVGDASIAYQVVGEGPLDVMFVSGMFSHVDGRWEDPVYARFLRRLAAFSRLVLFDRRGTGASDRLAVISEHTWEDWMDDVRAVLDVAGVEHTALIASSDAGPMAVLFAATYPERVSALVLINSAARLTKTDGYPWGMDPGAVDVMVDAMERNWGTAELLPAQVPSRAHDERFREWWSRYQRMSGSPRASRELARMVFSVDIRDVLPMVKVPTLLLHRRDYAILPPAHARFLEASMPNAKLIELPGADGAVFAGDVDALSDEIEEFLTGVRGRVDIDRALATILFTDIVGSTDRAVQLGDKRWSKLLDEHDAIARNVIVDFKGRFLRSTGDGVMASFDGPSRAVRAAVDLRNAVHGLDMTIRSGLHSGEVELRQQEMMDGLTVHIAARIMGEAGGDEVLASSTVRDLVAGGGIEFEPRGRRQLKGVPDPWALYAVRS